MNPAVFVALALAGGVGAALRLFVDGVVRARWTSAYPVGTTVINLSGSLLLGLITGLVTSHAVPDDLQYILGVGLLGGYTTFSTASLETVRLLQQRRFIAALANGPGQLVVAVLAAMLGVAVGGVVGGAA